ncbi:MAG: hypothetical protein NUV64_02285 [Parcubacteria group bacterium]|nr:hypothetical protein [Parcubacteria group bacterium]MCR4342854.1 hypothetical protein [Patescibacteria group bacterium]
MLIPSALGLMFFLGMFATMLFLLSLRIEIRILRIAIVTVSGILIMCAVYVFVSTPEGAPVGVPRLFAGEYPVLSIATRDKDDRAYIVVEDGKDVILVSVKRSSVEGKSPSMMRVEKEVVKKIPKKFSFN